MAIQSTSAYGSPPADALPAVRRRTAAARANGRVALPAPFGVGTWLVVVLVGALVLGLVFGLSLFPRLDAGQRVINRLRPAFAPARVAGDQAAIRMVSTIVDTLNPIVNPAGGAGAEVPRLVGLLSSKTGLSDTQAVAVLTSKFPAVAHLLLALPLSSVTAELPGLETFLASTLHATPIPLSSVTAELPGLESFLASTLQATPAQLATALDTSFPALTAAITNLPGVTNGWDDVPGTSSLTTFDGVPVRTVPQVRDYFERDVIPAVADTRADFDTLASQVPALTAFPPLLAIIGLVVVIYGITLLLICRRFRRFLERM